MMQNISIFSLTAPGRQLADKLLALLPQAVHHHKPAAFIDTAQTAFAEQNRCIFICSTGIVMRALAPVLVDKHHDPAVLALDQAGRFVVVLLAGHEGGGCEFGRVVARHLGAQLVITSATDYSQPVYSIGLGSGLSTGDARIAVSAGAGRTAPADNPRHRCHRRRPRAPDRRHAVRRLIVSRRGNML